MYSVWIRPSETEEITRFHEELTAVVQIAGAAGEDGLVGIAAFRRAEWIRGAHDVIVILQVVVPADVDNGAGMRQPGEQALRLHLLGALQ